MYLRSILLVLKSVDDNRCLAEGHVTRRDVRDDRQRRSKFSCFVESSEELPGRINQQRRIDLFDQGRIQAFVADLVASGAKLNYLLKLKEEKI